MKYLALRVVDNSSMEETNDNKKFESVKRIIEEDFKSLADRSTKIKSKDGQYSITDSGPIFTEAVACINQNRATFVKLQKSDSMDNDLLEVLLNCSKPLYKHLPRAKGILRGLDISG